MTTKKKLYIGSNLKMYKNIGQTVGYLQNLSELTKDIPRDEMCLFIMPSFTSLHAASLHTDRNLIKLGAQNMFWEDYGPFTGEVSPLMLKEIGIDVIEIGHSERRQYFGETDFSVNKKVIAGLKNGFITLICIGETDEEKKMNVSIERLRQQLKTALYGVPEELVGNVWVAYEPVWSIGENGIPAEAEYAGFVHKELRDVLGELYPRRGTDVPILYGGSVNRNNAADFMRQPEIDGLFVGRAAWEAEDFNRIIRDVLPVWKGRT